MAIARHFTFQSQDRTRLMAEDPVSSARLQADLPLGGEKDSPSGPTSAPLAPRGQNRKDFLSNALNGGKPFRWSKYYHLRGNKSRRRKGAKQRLGPTNRRRDFRPEWRDQTGPIPFRAELKHLPRFPLSKPARTLLVDYYRHVRFLDLLEDGIPKHLAGEIAYNVQKRRIYQICQELEGFKNDPLAWFRTMVARGLNHRQIDRGRATRQCPIADAFFAALAGGQRRLDD